MALPVGQEWSGGPPEGWEWSGGLPRRPGEVRRHSWCIERPSQWIESGQEDLPAGQKWSEGLLEEPGVVGRPSWTAGSGRE